MPTYFFTCRKCDTVTDRFWPMHRSNQTIKCPTCGARMVRDLATEQRGTRATPGTWPMKSDAAGVAPHQVTEAMAHAQKIGIPTEFTPDGRAIFTGPEHRKQYCEAIGLFDRNAGYSDPQRTGRLARILEGMEQ